MVSKSAAKLKPAKKEKIDIESEIAAIKLVTVVKLKSEIQIADRLDTILSIRTEAEKFFKENPYTVMDYRLLAAEVKKMYENILRAYESLPDDFFMHEEITDPYDELVPEPNDNWTDRDLFKAMILFVCVHTYGNKMLQDHQRVLELMKKAGMEPIEEDENE